MQLLSNTQSDLFLAEIGWALRPPSRDPWDGLSRYLVLLSELAGVAADKTINGWIAAVQEARLERYSAES